MKISKIYFVVAMVWLVLGIISLFLKNNNESHYSLLMANIFGIAANIMTVIESKE